MKENVGLYKSACTSEAPFSPLDRDELIPVKYFKQLLGDSKHPVTVSGHLAWLSLSEA